MWRKFLVLTMVVSSCGLYEVGDGYDVGPVHGIWGGPAGGQNGAGVLQQPCYVTALDYQNGYDWHADQARETVKCSLVVYADCVPVMKVPVGEKYQISSDPDMHRVIGGDLFTDYSTDSETIIRKNGRILFSCSGRERICGMAVVGDDVFTLGQSRDGCGFSYRKNGEVLMSRTDADVVGELHRDGESLCFSFSERIRTAGGYIERYYAVVDGKVSQTALREDVVRVWDVLATASGAVYVASLKGLSSPVLVQGDVMTVVSLPAGAETISCSIFRSDDKIGVDFTYALKNSTVNGLWLDGEHLLTLPSGLTVSALLACDGCISCIANPHGDSVPGLICRDGEMFVMPDGYRVMGSGAVQMSGGILHVGLSSSGDGHPLVWKDGHLDTLDVNGYISTLYVGP